MAYGKVLYNRSLLAVVVIETRARDRKEKVYGRKTIAKFYFSNLKSTKKKETATVDGGAVVGKRSLN